MHLGVFGMVMGGQRQPSFAILIPTCILFPLLWTWNYSEESDKQLQPDHWGLLRCDRIPRNFNKYMLVESAKKCQHFLANILLLSCVKLSVIKVHLWIILAFMIECLDCQDDNRKLICWYHCVHACLAKRDPSMRMEFFIFYDQQQSLKLFR